MKTVCYLCCMLLLSGTCFSQQETDREIFERLRREMRQEYAEYQKQNEKEYAAYLRQNWIEYQLLTGIDPFSAPKPDTLPEATEKEIPATTEQQAVSWSEWLDLPDLAETTIEAKVTAEGAFRMQVPFYGSTIPLHHNLSHFRLRSTEEKDVASLWEKFGNKEVATLLANLIAVKLEKGLNDWAFFLLLDKAASQISQLQDANTRTVFRHYLLFKCGYGVQMGRINQNLVLLIPFEEMIYNRKYLSKEKMKYFLFADKELSDSGAVYSLPLSTNGTGRPLSLQLKEDMTLGYSPSPVKRSYRDFTLTGIINTNRIDFFNDIPQADFRIYATATVDKTFEADLLDQLSNQVKGKETNEALNWLLHFTQSAFAYASDHKQFGREKYFFPEETFFYPFSDCEDRAILFAYLVRNILQLEVVLLNYSDHVATAVAIPSETPGTYIQAAGKRYLLCDPTYIGADIGRCMPQYRKETPKVFNL